MFVGTLNLLFKKTFPHHAVKVKKIVSSRQYAEGIQERIAKKWEEESALASSENRLFYNGHLQRFEGFDANGYLTLFVSKTRFRDTIGVRPAEDLYQSYGLSYLPNAFSEFTIASTSDGKIPLVYRFFAGIGTMWALPSRYVYPYEIHPCISAVESLKKDLFQRDHPPNVYKNELLGIYRYPNICETTAICHLKLWESSDKIESARIEGSEHLKPKVKLLSDEKSSIRKFLASESSMHLGTRVALEVYTS